MEAPPVRRCEPRPAARVAPCAVWGLRHPPQLALRARRLAHVHPHAVVRGGRAVPATARQALVDAVLVPAAREPAGTPVDHAVWQLDRCRRSVHAFSTLGQPQSFVAAPSAGGRLRVPRFATNTS